MRGLVSFLILVFLVACIVRTLLWQGPDAAAAGGRRTGPGGVARPAKPRYAVHKWPRTAGCGSVFSRRREMAGLL